MLKYLNIKSFNQFVPKFWTPRFMILWLAFPLFFTSLLVSAAPYLAQEKTKKANTDKVYTLQDLLKMAVQYHPLLREGKGVIQQEKGIKAQAYSPYFPQIDFQSSYQRANALGSLFGTTFPFTTYNTGFSMTQLITDFGHTSAQISAANQSLLQSQENYRSTFQQVLFNVDNAYYQVLENQANVKVQKDSVNDLKQHLKQAESFYKVGTQPKIDVTQAEVNLTNGEYALVQANNNLAIAWTNLSAAVGKPNFYTFQLTGKLEFHPYSVPLQKALSTAYQNRPDLLALESELKSQQANLEAVSKQNYPVLSGSAGYGWRNNFFPPGTAFWNLGVSLNFPLFDGFKEAGELETARGEVAQIQAEVDNLKLTIQQAVQQAYLNLKSSKTNLRVSKTALRYAAENFHLADGSYKVGTADYLQYEDAEVSLVQAKTNYIQALANYNIAVASLKQAMGVLKQ